MRAREARAYEAYKRSNMYSLYDAYGRFSKSKADAWEYCRKLCFEKRGGWLKVITANTFQFTAGFVFDEDGGVSLETNADSDDIYYDEISSGLLIGEIRRNRAELLESLSIYYRMVILGEKPEDLLSEIEDNQ